MMEDLGSFFAANSRPPVDWRAPLASWAGFAVQRARDLEALRPGRNDGMLEVALGLRGEFASPAPEDREAPRESIATMCGYLHACASLMDEYEIPEDDFDAAEAAQDIAQATVEILIGMDGDYGDLDEPFAQVPH